MPPKIQLPPQNFSEVLSAIDNQKETIEKNLLSLKRDRMHKTIKTEVNIIGNIDKLNKNTNKEINNKYNNEK